MSDLYRALDAVSSPVLSPPVDSGVVESGEPDGSVVGTALDGRPDRVEGKPVESDGIPLVAEPPEPNGGNSPVLEAPGMVGLKLPDPELPWPPVPAATWLPCLNSSTGFDPLP